MVISYWLLSRVWQAIFASCGSHYSCAPQCKVYCTVYYVSSTKIRLCYFLLCSQLSKKDTDYEFEIMLDWDT